MMILTDLKVYKSLDENLDKEVLRVIELSPKWIPGTVDGKPEKMQMTIPFRFALNN